MNSPLEMSSPNCEYSVIDVSPIAFRTNTHVTMERCHSKTTWTKRSRKGFLGSYALGGKIQISLCFKVNFCPYLEG